MSLLLERKFFSDFKGCKRVSKGAFGGSKNGPKLSQENILFVSKFLNNLSPSFFNTWFSFS